MSALHDAVASIGNALYRGTDNLELSASYVTEDGSGEFLLLVTEDIPCEDVMGNAGPEIATVAFAEAPTFEDALVQLAVRLANAGYGAVAAL